MNNDWTDNWHDKLAEYEETPPAGLWEDIKAAMEKPATEVVTETETAAQSQRSLRRRYWISSAASVVLLLGLSLFYSFWDISAPEDYICVYGEEDVVEEKTEEIIEEVSESVSTEKQKPLLAKNNVKKEYKEPDAFLEKEEAVSTKKTTENKKGQNSGQKKDQKAEQKKETTFPSYENELLAYDDSYFESLNRRNKSKKEDGLSLSLFASNLSSSVLTSLVSTEITQSSVNPNNPSNNTPSSTGPDEDSEGPNGPPVPPENPTEEIIKTKAFDAKHHRPLRVGVSLSYPLNDRLSLTSGMSFVRLVSDITNNNDGAITNSRQKLTYVGIPLGVTYKLVEYKALSLYLAAGGMIEKCVSGKGFVELDDKGNTHVRYSNIEKRPQYSVFGGAGLQLSLGSSFSLFAEPRVSFYPDNHSQIINIYKDQPTNFDLNLGVRFILNK